MRFVLVETSHPGNIGSVARAMKTMGWSDLALVNPQVFPSEEAISLAAGGADILSHARVFSTLEAAVADCQWVGALSARSRSIPWPMMTPREAAEAIVGLAKPSKAALVLGRERSGLTNEELALCQVHIHIPANPEYPVLNVAQAAQIIAYECALAFQTARTPDASIEPLASHQDLEQFYKILESMLIQSTFLDLQNPKHLMTRLRRVFSRATLTEQELKMMHGVIKALFEHQ